MTKVTNIAKNTSYFTFALILQKVISFAYFTILARTFIPDELGKYYLAISLTTIFAIIIELGLSNVLTREIAKDQENASRYLASVIALKIPLSIIAFVSLIIFCYVLNYDTEVVNLVYLSSICMILDSFSASFFACLRGFHNLKYESVSSVIFQLVVLIFGMIVIKLHLNLYWMMAALPVGSIYLFTYSLLLNRHKIPGSLWASFDKETTKHLWKISIPFALFGIYQKLYMYFDTVLLSIFAGNKYVGLYQVSFKIIFALQFLPSAFTASLYPAFSSYWKSNREQLAITFERAMNYLIIISLPISIGTIFLADKILLLFKPEYIEAKVSLQIIMAALVFVFINFPIGSILNACDRQKTNTNNMAITLAASVILNLILIPKFQTNGASVTVLITNILMFVLGIITVPKIAAINFDKIYPVLAKSFGAAMLMAMLTYALKNSLNIFVVVILSGTLYFTMLFVLKAFRREDIISVYKSFKKS